MKLSELIEKLKAYPPDTEIQFVEQRYNGGGDEYYESELVFLQDGEFLWITPKCDEFWTRQNFGIK